MTTASEREIVELTLTTFTTTKSPAAPTMENGCSNVSHWRNGGMRSLPRPNAAQRS